MITELALASLPFSILLAAQLHAAHRKIEHYLTCPTYGVNTRQGVDAKWKRLRRKSDRLDVIFLDLDGMHGLNELYGHIEVDRRISDSLRWFREGEPLAGRWYSGDELIIVTDRDESLKAATRLLGVFQQHGLSATFGIAPCTSSALDENVAVAMALVEQAKAENRRGSINRT